MSRRIVTRAVFAPLVIAIATTAVPPASFKSSNLNEWFTETLPATFASVSASQLHEKFSQRLTETSATLSQFRAQLNAQLVETTSTIADTILRFDAWLVPAPSPVVAALPAPSAAAAGDASRPERTSVATAAMPAETTLPIAQAAPPRARRAAEETPRVTVVEQPALIEPPAREEVAKVIPEPPAPLPEPKSVAVKAPAQPLVLASLGAPEKIVEGPVPAAKPPKVAEPKAPEPKISEPKIAEPKSVREVPPEEKQIFASLGLPTATAVDMQPLAAERLAAGEAKVGHELKPADVPHLDSAGLDSPASPGEAGNLPMSTPLKLRPLTRADIPPPEKFASLGSNVHGDARNASTPALSGILPPEQQRVAYDAPPVTERPKSIGKRQFVDDTKYVGLGKPEALLEALKHMGANAKTLGLPASLWCADFMNMVLRKSGIQATGSRAARSYLQYGRKIDEPRVGAIAIFTRGKNGGHIGIVRGTDGNGNPIIVSGNHNNKVAEAVYPKSRVIAYVVPR